MYRIIDISKDGATRTDGRYPLRIGCVVEILVIDIGFPMIFKHTAAARGNGKSGYLQTSRIVKIESDSELNNIVIDTLNSVYTLTKFVHE